MGKVETEGFRQELKLLCLLSRSSQVDPSALPLFPGVGLAISLRYFVEMAKEDWLRLGQKPVFLTSRSSQLGPSSRKFCMLVSGPSWEPVEPLLRGPWRFASAGC